MKWLRLALTGLVVISTLSFTTALTFPTTSSAAGSCSGSFLTFPAWYNGLQSSSDCTFTPKTNSNGSVNFQLTITIIVLNVVDIILQLVGYASAIMLIVGGFKYMTAAGASDQMAGAKKTITNAIIGLVISILSAAIINMIVGAFSGTGL